MRRGRRRTGASPPTNLLVTCAAKVNIGWRVGDRRPDGFHEVSGLLQTISLCDRMEISTHGDEADVRGVVREVDGAPVGLTARGPEAAGLAAADNLILRAAEVAARRAPSRPTSIVLHKDIPVAAGLGGGSADAAGALVGCCLAWGQAEAGPKLLEAAAELGSDVAPILLGGLVAVSGRGERVRQVGSGAGFAVVIGVPDAMLSAAAVYARFDELPPVRDAALEANDLQAAAASLEPAVEDGLAALVRAGAGPVFVSGSGPVVAGIVPDPERAQGVADACRGAFRRVVVAEPVPWGVRVALGGADTSAR